MISLSIESLLNVFYISELYIWTENRKVEGKMAKTMVPRVKNHEFNKELCSLGREINVYVDSAESQVGLSSLRVFLSEINFIESSRNNSVIEFKLNKELSEQAEYYEIEITDDKILISYVDRLAARNAVSTLVNIIEKTGDTYTVPQGRIWDYPDFSFRSGLIESSGRAWMTLEELKQSITRMAVNKFNYVHFHFLEFAGCSVALDTFPKLVGYGPDNLKYTKDEVRDLVKFAGSVGIELIPGIEMPGHSQALLEAYPELSCKTEPGVNTSTWVTCAGSEVTYDAYEKLLVEVADLFPCKYVQIGADEIDFGEGSGREPAWLDCIECKGLCEREGISTEREIFYYVIRRVHEMATKLNKKIIIFNDQVDISVTPDIPKDVIIQFWIISGRGPREGCSFERFLEEGFTVINSHVHDTYVDFEAYATSRSINQWSPWSRPSFNPKYSKQIIGAEFCAWEKHPHFKYTLPSVMALYGDRLWNLERTDYDEKYAIKMTRNILGVNTPKVFNIFKYLGDVLPPRDDKNKAYLDKVDASNEELNAAKEILDKIATCNIYGSDAAIAYIDCINWVLENR